MLFIIKIILKKKKCFFVNKFKKKMKKEFNKSLIKEIKFE